MGTRLRTLWETAQNELKKKHFVFIPDKYGDALEKPDLFGEQVSIKFPSALRDIRDAAYCRAVGLNTAAVFHLMRVAERGMRALAKTLRVRLQKIKKAAKSAMTCPRCNFLISPATQARATQVPIDYAMWEEVLRALETKIKHLQASKKGKARDA